jgi:hypothetical protein
MAPRVSAGTAETVCGRDAGCVQITAQTCLRGARIDFRPKAYCALHPCTDFTALYESARVHIA